MSSRLSKWLALGGMAATILFIPVAFVIGETREGYSHLAEGISALSEAGAPGAWAQTTNFIAVGILVIGLALGLHLRIGSASGSPLGQILISAFGLLALIMSGIFPEDPVGRPDTTVGNIHSLAAGLGFLSVIAAMFVLSGRFRDYVAWKKLGAISPWFGLASLVLMLSYLMAQEGVIAAWQPWTGLIQRAMGGTVLLWLFLLAFRLYAVSKFEKHAP